MDSYIEDLKLKVNRLMSSPSSQLIKEIESLLRDIKRRDEIPQDLKRKLAPIINQLGASYRYEMGSDIPYLVISVIDKITSTQGSKTSGSQSLSANGQRTAVNAGQTAVCGQAKMKSDIKNKLSAFNILGNFGIKL